MQVSKLADKDNISTWPSYSNEEIQAVVNVLLSNKVNYWTGQEAREFELEFARYIGCTTSIAMANGTVVIEGALKAAGVKPGDEVVVTPRTFIASVSSIVNAGAIPVFADVDRDSQNITADSISKVLSCRTKAVICVHLAGWPCEMDAINELCSLNGIEVIEDCAQAHGAYYRERSVGTLSSIGCWSFCQDKIMTTGGEGGMISTSNDEYANYLWSYKDHGKSQEAIIKCKSDISVDFKWVHDQFGTNWRMTEMQAAIGRIQLKYLNQWSNLRRSNADRIWSCASQLPGVRVPEIPEYIKHAAYRSYVFIESDKLKSNWSRNRVLTSLAEQGIPVGVGSCPEVYLEKAFNGTNYIPSKRLPVAKELGETSLMFKVHPTMHEAEIDRATDIFSSVMKLAIK